MDYTKGRTMFSIAGILAKFSMPSFKTIIISMAVAFFLTTLVLLHLSNNKVDRLNKDLGTATASIKTAVSANVELASQIKNDVITKQQSIDAVVNTYTQKEINGVTFSNISKKRNTSIMAITANYKGTDTGNIVEENNAISSIQINKIWDAYCAATNQSENCK